MQKIDRSKEALFVYNIELKINGAVIKSGLNKKTTSIEKQGYKVSKGNTEYLFFSLKYNRQHNNMFLECLSTGGESEYFFIMPDHKARLFDVYQINTELEILQYRNLLCTSDLKTNSLLPTVN